MDFYQSNADQPGLLYRDIIEKPGNWVALKLVGTKSNRDAIGARVAIKAGGTVAPTTGYGRESQQTDSVV